MPRKSNIKEIRAAKLSKKIESTLSSISEMEISLAKYRKKLRVIHEEQLKALKRTARKERAKFMKEMTFPKGMALSPNFNSHSVQGLVDSDPPLLETNFLPLEAFALIANYLGPIELIAFTSVSMTISHKIAVIYPQLYRNLTLCMEHSISNPGSPLRYNITYSDSDSDSDSEDFEHIGSLPHEPFHEEELTKCNGFVSSLSGLKIDKDDRRRCLLRSTMIRLIFRIQYFVYAAYKKARGTHTLRDYDEVTPQITFIFDKKAFKKGKPPPRFSFLPLNSGTVLFTPYCDAFRQVTRRRIKHLEKGVELKSKGAVDKEAFHYMGYADCKKLRLEPLYGTAYTQGEEIPSFHPCQIAHFTQNGLIKNVPLRHLQELNSWIEWPHGGKMETHIDSVRFIDYNELRFMRKIEYLNIESQIEECEKKFESFLSMLM
jgi:hypothetical protein